MSLKAAQRKKDARVRGRIDLLDVPRRLEDLLVLLGALGRVGGRRVAPPSTLVDPEDHVRNVLSTTTCALVPAGENEILEEKETYVVVPAEDDEERARGGRDEDEPVLCERVVP